MAPKQEASTRYETCQQQIGPGAAMAADPAKNPPRHDARSMHFQDQNCRPQVREALDLLEGLFLDGLQHGFFEISLACEIVTGGKRQLVIRAGKSHKFTIPKDEISH
jgi:hypothetical protein